MTGRDNPCPECGHADLDPRIILVGVIGPISQEIDYREVITLKCQGCGWLGEQLPSLKKA